MGVSRAMARGLIRGGGDIVEVLMRICEVVHFTEFSSVVLLLLVKHKAPLVLHHHVCISQCHEASINPAVLLLNQVSPLSSVILARDQYWLGDGNNVVAHQEQAPSAVMIRE